jgi:hypothetical protein
MSEPWFNPNLYAWIPGTVLGVVGGTWGGLMGTLGPRGKAKRLMLGGLWMLLACSAILLVAGIVALLTGQPYGVWYGLGLAGLIGLLAIGANTPMALKMYRDAEVRRMKAQDLQS